MALEDQLTAEEQAQFDAQRTADSTPPPADNTPPAPSGADGQPVTIEPQPASPQGMVPHAAMHEERERRKATEAALAEERRQKTLLEERTNLLLQSLARGGAPQQQQVAEIPQLDKDPVGFMVTTLQRQGDIIQQLVQSEQQRNQFIQQSQSVVTLQQRARALEQEFAATNPDYNQAADHLVKARNAELMAVGYADPAMRQQIIAQEALQIANQAAQMGGNPAEMIYRLAELRGYRKPTNGNGTTQTDDSVSAPAARIANTAAAQQENRSLSNTRGGAPVPLTAQRLLEMPYDEFAKMIEKPEGRALLGE